MNRFFIPVAVFAALVVLFAVGLRRDPTLVPTPLQDKALPAFNLTQLHDESKSFAPQDMRGKVWLLNVWASWCVSCRIEHPWLMELAKNDVLPIVGLDYKDKRPDALDMLTRFGNPYLLSVQDVDGRVGIDLGVYGVPESYLVDKSGVIRKKFIGPITRDQIKTELLPLLEKWRAS